MPFITQGKTNVKYLLIVIILAIFAGGLMIVTSKMTECLRWWPSKQPQQVLSTDETADWQVYKNEEYGFKIKYPKDWVENEWPYGKLEELFFDISFSEPASVYWRGSFRIEILPNQNRLSLEEWMKNYKRESASGYNLIREITNTTLDDKIAKRVSVFDFDSTRIEIIAINKIGVYNLSFSDVPEGNDPDNSRHQQIYNQILSTFRFIEDGTTDRRSCLSQMFLDKEFSEVQEREDCFQDKEKIFYCIEIINKDFLIGPNQKNTLIVVREGSGLVKGEQPYYPHAAGLYHAWLAIFETKTNKIFTSPFKLAGDSGEINFYTCKDKTFITFIWSVGGQGLFYGGIQLLGFRDNNLEEVWSWKSGDGTLLEQEGDKIAVYRMQSVTPDFECADKCLFGGEEWAYLHSYNFKWDDAICGFRKDETAD